ncbi:hypothetical protein EV421DRAFT_1235395 [Armillaria borealis]|uniref:Uncharacterized protein n=1 Tax=Armillaria borealis TaxID=47425 RepID=A0AA39J3C8_9AGAR|nr:hypothetical protein EV421DRAFT_1235395 [Armillaria borealis]
MFDKIWSREVPAVTTLFKRLRPPRARCMKGILAIGLSSLIYSSGCPTSIEYYRSVCVILCLFHAHHSASLASRLLLLKPPKPPSSLQAQQRANPHPTSVRQPSRHRPYPASCDSLPPLSNNRHSAPPFPTSRVSLHPASSLSSKNNAASLPLT